MIIPIQCVRPSWEINRSRKRSRETWIISEVFWSKENESSEQPESATLCTFSLEFWTLSGTTLQGKAAANYFNILPTSYTKHSQYQQDENLDTGSKTLFGVTGVCELHEHQRWAALCNFAVFENKSVGTNQLWGAWVCKSSLVSAHHVQAATVHECSELMKADLCGVQYFLNLLQTLLGRSERK